MHNTKTSIILLILFLSGIAVFANNDRLPGSSIADNRLQADTLSSVYATSAMVTKSNCNKFKVINTEQKTIPEYNKIYKGHRFASSPWIEEWTVDACGQKLVVPIAFIPDKKGFGTSFSITPKYIYELSK